MSIALYSSCFRSLRFSFSVRSLTVLHIVVIAVRPVDPDSAECIESDDPLLLELVPPDRVPMIWTRTCGVYIASPGTYLSGFELLPLSRLRGGLVSPFDAIAVWFVTVGKFSIASNDGLMDFWVKIG